MTKASVTFLLDTDLLGLSPDSDLHAYVAQNMLVAARTQLKRELHNARRDADLASEAKAKLMAARMQAIMGTFMAEANLVVEEVDPTTVVDTTLPHETENA